ncbi:hypothetical protein SAMN04487845_1267 [Methylobacterium sp. yr668]|nr:hypothetical protein SAMN04487845_1267 [Methylobacterium sp. yr668]
MTASASSLALRPRSLSSQKRSIRTWVARGRNSSPERQTARPAKVQASSGCSTRYRRQVASLGMPVRCRAGSATTEASPTVQVLRFPSGHSCSRTNRRWNATSLAVSMISYIFILISCRGVSAAWLNRLQDLPSRSILYGAQLLRHYWTLRSLGLVRSKRDFATRWLKRGGTYLRDIEFRDRGWRTVNPGTSALLRVNLIGVAKRSPPYVAAEIGQMLAAMDRDEIVARALNGSLLRQ